MRKYNLLQGLSNTEIAKLIGTVRHVVERHLKALKEDGTITTKNKNVQILDINKLLDKIKLFLILFLFFENATKVAFASLYLHL